MPQYIINLSDAQDKALRYVAKDPQDWIENAAFHRCHVAIEELFNLEVQKAVSSGSSISGTKEEIVLASDEPSAADRELLDDSLM